MDTIVSGLVKLRMLNIVFFLFLAMHVGNTFSQSSNHMLVSYEDSIQSQFHHILKTQDDSMKRVYNEKIKDLLRKVLVLKESFLYPFDSLQNLGKLISPDKAFRIYNWNLNYSDGTFEYFGFIQVYSKEIKSYQYFELIDQSAFIENPEDHIGDHKDWFGALYYQIIMVKDGKQRYYTLLGWDGNNDFSNKKLIEVLYFTRSGTPKFGKSIFKADKFKKKRMIFEYSYLASMTLRFNEALQMIVYDHLAPSNPKLEGQYQYYGPDFSYDGLFFKNGKWNEETDIDVRNPKSNTIRKKNISYTF